MSSLGDQGGPIPPSDRGQSQTIDALVQITDDHGSDRNPESPRSVSSLDQSDNAGSQDESTAKVHDESMKPMLDQAMLKVGGIRAEDDAFKRSITPVKVPDRVPEGLNWTSYTIVAREGYVHPHQRHKAQHNTGGPKTSSSIVSSGDPSDDSTRNPSLSAAPSLEQIDNAGSQNESRAQMSARITAELEADASLFAEDYMDDLTEAPEECTIQGYTTKKPISKIRLIENPPAYSFCFVLCPRRFRSESISERRVKFVDPS